MFKCKQRYKCLEEAALPLDSMTLLSPIFIAWETEKKKTAERSQTASKTTDFAILKH